MQQTNEVAILKVETIQLIASRLRIHHVFIYDERGTLGVICDTLTNLTNTGGFKVRQLSDRLG